MDTKNPNKLGLDLTNNNNINNNLNNFNSTNFNNNAKDLNDINFTTKQAKTFTKNIFNINNSNSKLKMPKNYLLSPPATANPQNFKLKTTESLDLTNKEHMKEFIANRQKVNNRLNSMYKESMNNINNANANNSVGQRILIKNSRGGNVEDRFSKTTKIFY